jgi:hypothetical protein
VSSACGLRRPKTAVRRDGRFEWITESGVGVVLRTGIRAGMFGERKSSAWWVTNDGGRNWAETPTLSPFREPIGAGRFPFMYGSRDVVRITPSPPTQRITDRHPPRLRSERLLRTAQGNLAGATLVAGGVLVAYHAQAGDQSLARSRVVRWSVRDSARSSNRALPGGSQVGPCVFGEQGKLQVSVEWPTIVLTACERMAVAGSTGLARRWPQLAVGRLARPSGDIREHWPK